jgi:xanthine dehydrogenase accessory factor
MGVYAELKSALESGKKAALVTVIPPGEDSPFAGRKLAVADGIVAWSELSPETSARLLAGALPLIESAETAAGRAKLDGGNGLEFVVQPFAPPPRLIILGGGHVGAALSAMAAVLDYHITVIDDRPSFASPERHPGADRVICEDFARALDALKTTPSDYIVIVTRGHRHDRLCLEKLLGRNVAYIGMIGSRRRVHAQLADLAARGYAQDDLAKVHAPIGLDIGAETSGEIALSILAEITRVRRTGGVRHAVEEDVLRELVSLEEEGGRAVLATVIKTYGSTPRKSGAWMLIFPDGRTVGTIGGGCAEAEVRREALQLMGGGRPRVIRQEMTADAAAEEGMACGGIMEIFLERLAEQRKM